MEFLKIQARITLEIAVSQRYQISTLRKNIPDELQDVVMTAVAMLAKSLNVHKNLDGEQIFEISTLLIEKYWQLRPEEIFYVFKNAKTGKYGPVDYKLDITLICRWVDQYLEEERFPYFERMSANYSKNPDESDALRKELMAGAEDSRLLQQLNNSQQLKRLK